MNTREMVEETFGDKFILRCINEVTTNKGQIYRKMAYTHPQTFETLIEYWTDENGKEISDLEMMRIAKEHKDG